MIYRLQSGQNGSKFGTILWSHTLRPAPSPETIYALVPYGLSSIGPVQNPQTIYGLKILKKSHDLVR
jgi:hypothetical protein